ncbi:MAG: ribose-phosphate pyrophosphokinase [Kineosporiaceae bacterium]|jgi:ribose-phosphate pyrophosphokinase
MTGDLDFVLMAGSSSQELGQAIAAYLDHPLSPGEVLRFSDGNTFVRVLSNVRGRDVFLVQAMAFAPNDEFVELLFWIDALKRASASSVTVVLPYFSYAKGDKKDEPRVSIRARVCADALEVAGADRVVTMDLHAPQVQGFFRVPVDDLRAEPVLAERLRQELPDNLVIVAPDAGFAKRARGLATRLGAPLAIADKRRVAHDENAEIIEVIGDVEGRVAVLVDDFSISAGTLCEAAAKLADRGATRVVAAISHGLLTGDATARIEKSPIERLYMTDTIEGHPTPLPAGTEVVSIAPLFGEAIRRISKRESISVLFS